jgi:LPS sulfotransferase NodH
MIRRVEPELTEKFRKNPQTEAFLAKLNRILAPHQEEDYIADLPERYPTVHVIGVPRSGTTLLTQLLAAHTDIGYINNLIAAFWKAPVYGIRLSAQVVPRHSGSSYQSEFGRTQGIHEPHEFGYFWSELLDYQEMREQPEKPPIDWNRVRLVLTNMTHAAQRPIVFKSFLLAWHIAEIQAVLPKTCWIHIRRDPIQNAISLLHLRRDFLGSVDKWASLKPKEYEWLSRKPYWEQVVGQIYFLEKGYREKLRSVPAGQVLSVSYEQLCHSPDSIIQKIQAMLAQQGVSVQAVTPAPSAFSVQRYDLSQVPELMKLQKSWQSLIDQYGPLG